MEELAVEGIDGLLVGGLFVQGEEAGLPVGGELAGVDFVAEVAVDDPVDPDGGAEGGMLGGGSGDAGDDPVGVGEVKAGIEAEGHDGGGGVGCALSGDDGEFAGVVHAGGVVGGGERVDVVEVVAFDPVLELAGSVAGVFAGLKHGDDDNFDGDGGWGLGVELWQGGDGEDDGGNLHG